MLNLQNSPHFLVSLWNTVKSGWRADMPGIGYSAYYVKFTNSLRFSVPWGNLVWEIEKFEKLAISKTSGYEHIFSWYQPSVSIWLKTRHVIGKSIQKLVNLPNLMVIGLNTKAWYTFKIRGLSMDWRTPVPPIHTKCTMPLGVNQ